MDTINKVNKYLPAFITITLLITAIFFLYDSHYYNGKLQIVFCDVGQGDAIYIRFPNRADMLIDGGPNDRVLTCLSKNMPFYDRTLDVVALTHPQNDHYGGLISVVERYNVSHFVTVPVAHTTKGYQRLVSGIKTADIPVTFMTAGEVLKFREVVITVLWPEKQWLLSDLKLSDDQLVQKRDILGVTTGRDLNTYSLYFYLRFADFDALFTGDGDVYTQKLLRELQLESQMPKRIELLKVPHHGALLGMEEWFVNRLQPRLSVIQVGKNSYGHPRSEIIELLSKWGSVVRTDVNGDTKVEVNGSVWKWSSQR